MRQKILVFVVSLVVAFSFSTKNSWAVCSGGDCTTDIDCGAGNYCSNCYCYANAPTSATHRCQYEGCKNGSCVTKTTNEPNGTACPDDYCSTNSDCAPVATATRAPTSAPTAIPTPVCEGNDNNICNNGSSYCENQCAYSGNYARVRCSTNFMCSASTFYCYDSQSYTTFVGPIYCPPPGAPTPTTYCHPISCYSAPDPVCPGFNPASTCASSGGVGNCDNCGGMDCGSCSGVQPTGAVPTSAPGCISDCLTNSCRNNLCSDTTCLGSCGIYCYGVLSCISPTFTSLVIKNASNLVVTKDASNRNNICEAPFYTNANPRKVIFEASVADMDGYTDIASVKLRWQGNIYDMILSSGSVSNATYTVTVDYSAVNDSGTYPLEINVTDSKSKTTGWVATNRNWKVWNCQVPVSGTVYESSGGQSCSTDFLTTAPPEIKFNAITFSSVLANVSMAVNSPNYGTANLIWGQTYLPLINNGDVTNINGDLLAANRFTQIIDTAANITSCSATTAFNIGNYVSAYSANPSALIDLSFIRVQGAWFQVVGAGIKAKNNLDSGVPVTANSNVRALTLSGLNADNALVSFSTFSNINGNNDSSGYGIPNNWWTNVSTNDSTIYSYQYFYNNFLIKKEIGMTGTNWNGRPSEGVYLVSGDLTIDSDFSLASDKFMMVVARGKIIIANNVNQLDGIYVADGGIEALGTSDTQLIINGSLYSRKTIKLARSYSDKSLNNTSPAIKINYNPALIFNMPGKLMLVLSNWREE